MKLTKNPPGVSLCGLACLWLCACATTSHQVASAPAGLSESERLRQMEERLNRLEIEEHQIARQALCPREVRRLLDDGRRECRPGIACSNPEIGLFVNDADPTHQGRFVTLMDSQDHRAFYLKDPVPQKPSADLADPFYRQAIGEKQIKGLKRLLQPRLLSTTQFLVVSHPGERRDNLLAERRGAVIIDQILAISAREKIELKPERILHWIYPFTLRRGEKLRPEDHPPPGSSLNQSVWVFRVDC